MKAISNMLLSAAALAAMLVAIPAHACRISRGPFNPTLARSDVIIVGRVAGIRQDVPIVGKWFRVRVQAVLAGQFTEAIYETGWPISPGTCGPRGPDVAEGEQVAIYFEYRDGRPIEQGWIKIPS
ncbi:hypothetical protein [Sphingomonas panacis]|uniref:hypothetical protein n=1 Tax=Sphingomonas panacis TaxID=1560345 RepID=UPI001237347B|nr:hypothetical protein [Sphingomonas panacis]